MEPKKADITHINIYKSNEDSCDSKEEFDFSFQKL